MNEDKNLKKEKKIRNGKQFFFCFPIGFDYLKSLFRMKDKRNNRGQGLIEYLILVAIMGVATIGIIRTLNQTIKSRFANAIYALQGKSQKAKTHNLKKEEYQRSDLSNFMSGAASSDKKKNKAGK